MSLWDEALELAHARRAPRGVSRVLYAYQPPEELPRLHLDRYGTWWVATFHATELEDPRLDELATLLSADAEGVVYKFRNDPRKPLVRGEVRHGDPEKAKALVVEAEGYRLEARPAGALDAGVYPDAEPLRQHLLRTSSGKRVLNLFAYTCLYGVAAAKGGARTVVNVDASRAFLAWGRRNFELNELRADARDFVAEDAHLQSRRFARAGTTFDVVVFDPPPFYRKHKKRWASEELLEEAVQECAAVASREGVTLHLLQCAARVTKDELRARVEKALAASARPAKVELVEHARIDVTPRELAPTFKEARVELAPG